MQPPRITPRHLAPYVIGGATGVHVLARMRRLSRQPAMDISLQHFLFKNTDVVLALSGASVVIWQLAKHRPRQEERKNADHSVNGTAVYTTQASLIATVAHELRQVFAALLLGLGITERRARKGQAASIPGLVQRMKKLVRRGIEDVSMLEASESTGGHEREYGA